MSKKPLTDQQLALRARRGDEDAFQTLVSRYRGKLLSYLWHLSASQDEADDLLQDIFIKAYRALPRFDARRRFSPWVYRIAHNEAVNLLKRRNRRTLISWEDIANAKDNLEIADLSETPEERVESEEERKEMQRALEFLSPEHREVLVLRYYHDKSYAEMSEIIGKPENTVASMLNRAKKKLAERMERRKSLRK